MSFDYLKDLFGKFRKTESKYAAVERQAAQLIHDYVRGHISQEEIDDDLVAVRKTWTKVS